MQWGAQHRIPLNMSLPPIGPLIIAPFISYEETWITHRIQREWNITDKKVDTLSDRRGLFIDRQMSFGFGLNTNIYGMFTFKRSKLIAIRHIIRPNISFNYRPNLSKKFYDVIQEDTFGHRRAIPQFDSRRNLYSGYGYGKFGGLTFGVDNNLEAKVKNKKDTTTNAAGEKGVKRIKLIDGFGFSSGYNFLQDSLKFLPFNLYLRTTLFEKVSITAQAVWSPYKKDSLGRTINQYVWQGDKFSLGRLDGGSVSMSTNFQSKPRDATKAPVQTPTSQITDPNLLADRERLQDYVRRNPAEFVDFNIPWTIGLSYSLYFNPERRPNGTFKTKVSSNISFNNSFSLTPKWNFTTNGYYDFDTKQLTMFTMSVSRDMHCWQMSISVTPIGNYRTFNISINPKSELLRDLKVNRSRTFYNY
jgi:hypothetical protein